jgi:hypothetical protein
VESTSVRIHARRAIWESDLSYSMAGPFWCLMEVASVAKHYYKGRIINTGLTHGGVEVDPGPREHTGGQQSEKSPSPPAGEPQSIRGGDTPVNVVSIQHKYPSPSS